MMFILRNLCDMNYCVVAYLELGFEKIICVQMIAANETLITSYLPRPRKSVINRTEKKLYEFEDQ